MTRRAKKKRCNVEKIECWEDKGGAQKAAGSEDITKVLRTSIVVLTVGAKKL